MDPKSKKRRRKGRNIVVKDPNSISAVANLMETNLLLSSLRSGLQYVGAKESFLTLPPLRFLPPFGVTTGMRFPLGFPSERSGSGERSGGGHEDDGNR